MPNEVATDVLTFDESIPEAMQYRVAEILGDETYTFAVWNDRLDRATRGVAIAGWEMGQALLVIRSQMDQGDWGPYLDSKSLSRSAACRLMHAAQNMTREQAMIIGERGGKSKMLLLAEKLDADQIGELTDDDLSAVVSLDDVESMGVHALRRKLTDATNKVDSLEKRVERGRQEVIEVEEQRDVAQQAHAAAVDGSNPNNLGSDAILERLAAHVAVIREQLEHIENLDLAGDPVTALSAAETIAAMVADCDGARQWFAAAVKQQHPKNTKLKTGVRAIIGR